MQGDCVLNEHADDSHLPTMVRTGSHFDRKIAVLVALFVIMDINILRGSQISIHREEWRDKDSAATRSVHDC